MSAEAGQTVSSFALSNFMSDVVLPLHLLSLAYVAWNVFHADHLGFKWMTGKVDRLEQKKVDKYHKATWVGLGLMIATGFTLFCNSFVIGKLKDIAVTKTFASLSTKEKIPLFISGAVSTVSWLMAALAALYLVPEY